MSKRKRASHDPDQLSLLDLSQYDSFPQPDIPSEATDGSEDVEPSHIDTSLESSNRFENVKPLQPDSPLESPDGLENLAEYSRSQDRLLLFVPDRFDVLERRAKHQHELKNIIVAVDDALASLDDTYSDIVAAGRGSFWVFRGSSGSGKSTFLHTVNLFRPEVETLSIQSDEPVPQTLTDLRKAEPVLKKLRIIVIEGREALTDFSVDQLEKDLHSINSFIRSKSGERTLVVWPCNADDLEERLIKLAERIGADSLLGVGDPVYRFQGPPQDQYIEIATRTIETLNEGASLVDLGVLEYRAKQLIQQAETIGKYLNLLRQELRKNEKNVEKLFAQEKCRMWIVVIAGNNPEQEVAALTRGGYSKADIPCLMNSTQANVVEYLKRYSDKIGILGTVLEAKVIYLPIATARSIVIKYANDELREKMIQAKMPLRKEAKADDRLMKSELAQAFQASPKGLSRTNSPSRSSREPFEKLTIIAQKNDELLNLAIGKGLKACGLVSDCKTEAELRGRIKLRSDLLCTTDSGLVRVELMWTKWANRADIANYVLKKLQSYGQAIGLLE
jgi:DNA (cytosine-5)-methyltransferase 1